MSASKKDFQVGEELVILETRQSFFEEHHELLFDHCNIKRVYVKNEDFKEDQEHKKLRRNYASAVKELRDYEWNNKH